MKKSGKFVIRRMIDLGMTVCIVLLLASQITGQMAHEWTGIFMFILFIAHTVMNRAWYKNLFKGKYRAVRILQTVIDLSLFVCFILTAVSGMLMSQYALSFLRRESTVGTARAMHLAFSHWTFILISTHLGIHWGMMTGRAKRKVQASSRGKIVWGILSAAAVAAAGYGMFLSVRAQIFSYMAFQVQFAFLDYNKSAFRVILENILMMSSWVLPAYEVGEILKKPDPHHPHGRWVSAGMIAAEFILAAVLLQLIPTY